MSLPTLVLAVATFADCFLLLWLHYAPHCTPLLLACRYLLLLPAVIWSLRSSRQNV